MKKNYYLSIFEVVLMCIAIAVMYGSYLFLLTLDLIWTNLEIVALVAGYSLLSFVLFYFLGKIIHELKINKKAYKDERLYNSINKQNRF